ncbi:disease resistance protein RPV1-like [Hibiscus syriacus]|uniref:disease resistance protein RPV1-like n=1 Tax=Hibiscus syriacus TaxID=106335 RepID=UPI001921F024|nr:disease resistance protein RPV1-like [Hibiscus syriacus]
MNVFFDEEKLEKGVQLSHSLSQAIAACNISIIVWSANYASSKSYLAELSYIMVMGRKVSQQHTALPIFYHVDPSDVRNLGGSFRTSFEEHEPNRPLDEVKRWKAAFVDIGKLKGWHIDGGKSDRPDSEYIKDVVQYVIEKLNNKSRSVYEELVGIDDQKKMILKLIKQGDNRLIELWGMGGIGKTTLAEAVYKEISHMFQGRYFLQNVKRENRETGKRLNSKTCVDTPSIGSTLTQQRLNNIKSILVHDDVNDSDQIDFMGVKYFGEGSKIIVTWRGRQVLKNGGADEIHEVKKLNKDDSLILFSSFAFKMLNPAVDFQDLSYKFVQYAQGSPLALKILGSKLYKMCRKDWESEVDKLKEYAQPKILQILKSSYEGLDELEKNIFLDIACFFNWEHKDTVETILSGYYKGVVSGINNLVDKCLLDVGYFGSISMHDMLEEMGKDVIHQESKDTGKRGRIWNPKDVNQVLRYNKYYPFKSLSPSFNLKNLLVLRLPYGHMEQLWNEDNQDLVNLRTTDLIYCKKQRKIPNLSEPSTLKALYA